MRRHLSQRTDGDIQQPLSVDVHKVAPYVKMQHIAFSLPIKTLLATKVADATDTVMRTTTHNATVGIGDEGALKKFVGIVEVKMMYNTVAELRSKYLALFWVVHNKALARQRAIGAIEKVITQPLHIFSHIGLPFPHIRPLRLVPFGVVECLVNIL